MALALFRVGRNLHGSISAVFKNNIIIKEIRKESVRSIMTSESRLEKVLEDLKTNPYFEKYAKKIVKLQETSPEVFLSRFDDNDKKKLKSESESERIAKERKFQQASKAKPDLEGLDNINEKKLSRLNDIMNIELIKDKNRDEIIKIWHEYHKLKDCISGVMSAKQYEKLFERGKNFPTFLLPLPRSEGYEFIMTQFHATEIHMTPLLWYQVHKENAPECLSMKHYADLSESKDLVLMRGEFDTNSINVQEAQCLANELQLYYATDNTERLLLLEKFTKKPDQFNHTDLIANLETISLSTDSKAADTI